MPKIHTLGKTVQVGNMLGSEINQPKLIRPVVFSDDRGGFFERYRASDFLPHKFLQENISYSTKGVFRGLHFQLKYPQGKLCNVLKGKVWDVFMDLRFGSPDFLKLQVVDLSSDNNFSLWIPPGFAHGFLVESDFAIFQYRCTEYYEPEFDSGVSVYSPEISRILLQVIPSIIDCKLSPKDKSLKRLMDLEIDDLERYKEDR